MSIKININCDLIVHSRGENQKYDNLIALEMKKNNRLEKSKVSDRERIIALTQDDYKNIKPSTKSTILEHVCGYKLGIYYEVNFKEKRNFLEYYSKGRKISDDKIKY